MRMSKWFQRSLTVTLVCFIATLTCQGVSAEKDEPRRIEVKPPKRGFSDQGFGSHGGMEAKAKKVDDWETFGMEKNGDYWALNFHSGYLSEKRSGHGVGAVYANSDGVGDSELWRIQDPEGNDIQPKDGRIVVPENGMMVTIKSRNGYFFQANEGGGQECGTDSRKIGDWQLFRLENAGKGKFSLKTKVKQLYVTAVD